MRINRYTFIVLASITLTSCDEFLSKQPDNRTVLNTEEKITELLVSAYPEANYITFCEAMSDNVSEHPGAFVDVTNTDPFYWREVSETEQDSPEYYWNACYAAIAAANHALEAIANSEDPSALNAQRGEALVARAYSHFLLVSLFANMYDESTAETDPGIPYVTEPETIALKTYDRGTVQYVYDMIEKDLKEGIPLIRDEIYAAPKFHFTRSAAHAFAVRYYLFKRDYEKVIEHANQVFPDNDFASKLRGWNSTYRTMNLDELELTYTRSTEPANLLLCETSSLWARTFYNFRYSTGVQEFDEIMSIAGIVGGQFAYTEYFISSLGIHFVPKFAEHFVREDISADIGLPYTIVPLFTAEEVLLSRAEANAFLGKTVSAFNDINTFFSKRIVNYNPAIHTLNATRANAYFGTNNTLISLLETIISLRRAEFLHEGLRWFDIRRWDFDVFHITAQGEILELPAGDPRRTLQIPREAIRLGGLEANPR